MTQVAVASDFRKDYLPGYTGHVPTRTERFGSTAGQIKREILEDLGKPSYLEPRARGIHEEANRLYSDRYVPKIDKNK